MTTTTLTLTDFLLARIAEDEEAARVCAEVFPPSWDVSDRGHSATVRADAPNFAHVSHIDQSQETPGRWPGEHLEHIARHDPARVLAGCERDRRIVEMCRWADESVDWVGDHETYGQGQQAADILRALGQPYADHPDYREAWRP